MSAITKLIVNVVNVNDRRDLAFALSLIHERRHARNKILVSDDQEISAAGDGRRQISLIKT